MHLGKQAPPSFLPKDVLPLSSLSPDSEHLDCCSCTKSPAFRDSDSLPERAKSHRLEYSKLSNVDVRNSLALCDENLWGKQVSSRVYEILKNKWMGLGMALT